MVCSVPPVSCKAKGDKNQLGAWLDSDLIVELYLGEYLHNWIRLTTYIRLVCVIGQVCGIGRVCGTAPVCESSNYV